MMRSRKYERPFEVEGSMSDIQSDAKKESAVRDVFINLSIRAESGILAWHRRLSAAVCGCLSCIHCFHNYIVHNIVIPSRAP